MTSHIPESSNWQGLTDRVEKLERQNRRMKQAGTIILILAAAVVLMRQAPTTRTVEANEFVLRDANGRMRAMLKADEDLAGLSFFDANEKPRVSLSVDGETAILAFADANENLRAGLSVHEGMAAALAFYDANGKVQAGLVVSGGDSVLTVSDNEGFQTVIGTADFETSKTTAASVSLLGTDKKPQAILSLTDFGPGLILREGNGEATTILVVEPGSPSLSMKDEDGKVLWEAP